MRSQNLKSIELSHFQSHKDSKIELDSGINVIIGNSKDGKTAILRGIRQVKDNKPTGLTYNSYWNRDKKKQPVEEHFAKLNFDDASISRIKAKDRNDYEIDRSVLEAVGKGAPPEEVTKALNLTETNFQAQFSRPFLLDDSAAEVGRFFNKIVNLDLSDKVLAEVEKDRRNTKSKIESTEEEINKLQEDFDSYSWVDKAEKLIEDCVEVEEKLKIKEKDLLTLQTIYATLIENKEQLKEINKIPFKEIYRLLDEVDDLSKNIENTENMVNELFNLSEDLRIKKEELQGINKIPFVAIYEVLDEIESIEKNIFNSQEEKRQLIDFCTNIKNEQSDLKAINREVMTIKRELTAIRTCPTCNRPF